MTLVVARIIENQIKILSDTKITDPSGTGQGLSNHILKAVIINPNLCICFAQTISKALRAIKEITIYGDSQNELDRVLMFFLEKHREGNNDPDFIIAALKPHPSLHRISQGEMISTPATWIGNKDAFEDYQKHYQYVSQLKELPEDISLCMEFAIRHLIDEAIYDDIGDFVIGVTSSPEGFSYINYTSGISAIRISPTGESDSISSQTAAMGGNSYSVVTPRKVGIGAIGLHFYQGKFGAILYPTKNEKPIIYANVTMDQFKLKVLEDFGFEFIGKNIVDK